ncbi:MAG: phytase [bacterium]|nr:phytase [bacterium]
MSNKKFSLGEIATYQPLLLAIVVTATLLGGVKIMQNQTNLYIPDMTAAKSVQNTAKNSPLLREYYSAVAETDPVPNKGDAADDIAIWVNPTNRTLSTVIGSDKAASGVVGGFGVYDLQGKQIQYVQDGKINNVDLRQDFMLGGKQVALVAGGRRNDNTIALYIVNPQTRMLEKVEARTIAVGLKLYGSALYKSPKSGKLYFFVNSKTGDVQQWELFGTPAAKVDAKLVRSFKLKSKVEGMVADDELGNLYISEETVGIWKFGAEPTSGATGIQVDTIADGKLFADIEGLTIAYNKKGSGFLIASSQGDNSYVMYRREGNNEFVKRFQVIDGNNIDGTFDPDGIDVTTENLGHPFTGGLFVTQDGANDNGNQNFKFVPWHLIEKGIPNNNSSWFKDEE